jgi:RHH-type proline utilization regulon transcriptional repressor/proline dehydrogenase/delta 1-pyrroline-5-carboxylate dehydrogenase
MSLTAEAFMCTLDRPGLEQIRAGIALQAYIPDSRKTQREILSWARRRVARGGAPITIRLVKGANLEMERVEASLRGWPQAPFKSKQETDANYVRMMREALRPENLAAARLGVASHNLFDLALGAVLTDAAAAGGRVQFEMLEGMANHQRRAIAQDARDLLLYAPACRKEEFVSAIGYLVRRLDENTGPNNFLRHAFRLRTGSEEWELLEQQFRESCTREVPDAPRRTQDRRHEVHAATTEVGFTNEPDTDFALPHHSEWARQIIDRWQPRHGEQAVEIPLVIAGEEHRLDSAPVESMDPSWPRVVVARHWPAGLPQIEAAIDCARRDPDGWRALSPESRSEVLARVAVELRAARGDLIGAAMANTGKTISEADPEISEAVDFVEYYRRSASAFYALPTVEAAPVGVVIVVPPWNFPIAIPCGGIAAALAAGNTVIMKPATPSVLVAWELCQAFWRGGISKSTLQFLPCSGNVTAGRLVTDPEVDAVILTGGTATAMHLLRERPALRLSAETGGKNATIVTALSDREQAVKHVIHSAFSHGGQKCSATSLLLLEAEVYDDPHFQKMLVDATSSLRVGPAWDLDTRIGPLIRPPTGELERGLKTLEPGESWALLPERLNGNPHLWSPGIKYGVQPGSFTHLTELFGPVLGVMRFTHLEEAIALVNQTGYGLTSGLQSLDDREQAVWKAGIRAGNLYINKPTVGAIVLRQPFGGIGKSAIGPALKAGGPNYVSQFMSFRDAPLAEASAGVEIEHPELAPLVEAEPSIRAAIRSYEEAWRTEFGPVHDDFRLLGEDNLRRYLPICDLRLRIGPDETAAETYRLVSAARIAGCRVIVSMAPGADLSELDRLTEEWGAGIEFLEETDEELAAAVRAGALERLRFAAPNRVPAILREAAADSGVYLADRLVSSEGRIELLHYVHEQSVSFAYHRYGNLGARAGEARQEPE